MPFIKISGLTTATAVSATNQFEINQNGASRSLEVSVLDSYIRSGSSLPVVVSVSSASDALRITQTGTGNALVVEDSANPDSTPFVVNADGRLIAGSTALQTTAIGTSLFQLFGGTNPLSMIRSAAASTPINLEFAKARGGELPGTALISGDTIGRLYFSGSDGSTMLPAAFIDAAVDGTPGTNDMPGRLVFSTTADGASSPTERMRIDNLGRVGVGSLGVFGNTVLGIRASLAGSAQTTNYGVRNAMVADSAATANIIGFSTTSMSGGAGASPYTTAGLIHYRADTFTLGANQTVTNQYGFEVSGNLTNATNNFGFYSNIAAGTGRWNFYANGTAANFFGGATTISTSSTDAALRITQTGTGNALVVEDSANPDATPFVVDADGRFIHGHTSALTLRGITFGNLLTGLDASTAGIALARYSANASPSLLEMFKSRGASVSTNTVVQSGDVLGTFAFSGADGSSFVQGATISAEVDGTPGTNDMPGRLVFSTTADGASSPTERMRINNAGRVGIGVVSPTAQLEVTPTIRAAGSSSTFAQLNGGNADGASLQLCRGGSATQNAFFSQFQGSLFIKNLDSGPTIFTNTTGDLERMRLTADGSLGLGTSSPADALTVTRASDTGVRIQSTAGATFLNFLNTTAAYVNNASNTPMLFQTNNTERMRITNAGNVGIGTSSPAYPLTINKAGATDSYAQWTNGAGGNFIIGTSNTGTAVLYNGANTPMTFVTNNITRANITAAGDFQFNSGYGSVATAFGCRAWVNFNGTGTPAIRASGNVSSITDNGTGDYTVNFTTAMPDANFAVVGSAQETVAVGAVNRFLSIDTTATTGARVLISFNQTLFDPEGVHVAIFR